MFFPYYDPSNPNKTNYWGFCKYNEEIKNCESIAPNPV